MPETPAKTKEDLFGVYVEKEAAPARPAKVTDFAHSVIHLVSEPKKAKPAFWKKRKPTPE
ncbi:hypothetical protein [Fimbriimonas ginsengisoli]|uniref:Uncharacterized protein n=1 Tax=Fimbriimonas ginsengisoli Gsoil 348 TaxID=661478 RepID=A0A068NN79_FIMGI|nr:hypothetical protein [Fimbriimonas ginsengisoli]AIE85008.1 hypothetical protein OP10G_1640 [Fimbriimonas ginsengisoli Gsoil 348]